MGDGEVFPVEERVCELCGDNKVEDEIHFLCTCTVYANMRVKLYRRPLSTHGDFLLWTDQQKFCYLMENESHEVANYLENACNLRKSLLYR